MKKHTCAPSDIKDMQRPKPGGPEPVHHGLDVWEHWRTHCGTCGKPLPDSYWKDEYESNHQA